MIGGLTCRTVAGGYGAQCGRFLAIVLDGDNFESLRRPAISAKYAPPGQAKTSPGHDRAHLTRPAPFKDYGYVAVGKHLPGRYQADDVQDSLFIVQNSLAHPPRLSKRAQQPVLIGAVSRGRKEMSYPADTVWAMNSWHMHPRAAFDLETTGRDPLTARIVTASIILVDGRGELLEHHEWLANPGVDIPAEATAVHGIATQTARAQGAPAAQVVNQIAAVLGGFFLERIPVLAFNARYDFTVLAREGLRYGVRTPDPFPVLDPYVMDKQTDRYRPGKRTLTAMCAHYGVPLENAHTSAADVLATLGVGAELAERFHQLRRPAPDLHEFQVTWALRQAQSFQEYLRRSDPGAIVEGRWPAIAS